MAAAVVYRWPGSSKWCFLEGEEHLLEVDSPIVQNGFVVSPFQGADITFISAEKTSEFSFFPAKIIAHAIQSNPIKELDSVKEEVYTEALKKAIESTQQLINKVVITRNKYVEMDRNTMLENFERLATAFPSALVYLLVSPLHGVWFGATPEILIKEVEAEYETMALAGTIRSEKLMAVSDFSGKERAEQEFVASYMRSKFQDLGLTFVETKTEVLQTGFLNHLVNYFKIKKHVNTDMIGLARILHPTPAICGLPVSEAKTFILEHEGYDRRLYTGYLGPVGLAHTGLFVNLRCGQLTERGVVLYAGGGINSGSTLEKEFLESQHKMENLWRFLL